MSTMDDLGFFDAPSPPAVNGDLADIMIDVESMGTRPNAPVLSIGAVMFDMNKFVIGEQYYCNISLESSVQLGSVIDPETVLWWMKQSDDARYALTKGGYPAADMLTSFATWLDIYSVELKSRRVWACGTDFDCVLLSEHYRKAGQEVPWAFWNQRDYRTLRALYPNVEEDPRQGKHNALDDAIHQVNHLFKIRRHLRVNKPKVNVVDQYHGPDDHERGQK
jgi:hypothetical protein